MSLAYRGVINDIWRSRYNGRSLVEIEDNFDE